MSPLARDAFRITKKKKKTRGHGRRNPLFFDCIPHHAVDHILRFLGDGPSADGISNVPAETALSVLRVPGSLSSVARTAFRSLHCAARRHFKQAERCEILAAGEHASTREVARALPAAVGGGLRTLFVRAPLTAPFTRAVVAHCGGLKSLSFRPSVYWKFPSVNLCAIIEARGGGLEELCVELMDANEAVVGAIARNCRALRKMKLWCRSVHTSLGQMWEAVGGGLEEVELRHSTNCEMLAIRSIPAACPRVTRLGLFFEKQAHEEVEAVCVAYGTKLLELDLLSDAIGVEALGRICAACPKVRINFPTGKAASAFAGASSCTVAGLGTFSSSWTVNTSLEGYCDSVFRKVGQSCPNLESCYVISDSGRPIREAAFGELFVYRKTRLRHFEVTACDVSSVSAILSVLAEKVCSLEKFSYEGPNPPLAVLKKFIGSQTVLKKVSLSGGWSCVCQVENIVPKWHSLHHSESSIGHHWEALLGTLLSNRSLVDIECHCNASLLRPPRKVSSVAEVCCSARARSISIVVCGHRYS